MKFTEYMRVLVEIDKKVYEQNYKEGFSEDTVLNYYQAEIQKALHEHFYHDIKDGLLIISAEEWE